MANIKWMTIEINGDASKLPQNGAWCFVDVNMPSDVRRKIQFDGGRFYDEKNRAVNPTVVMNWHVPMDEKDMEAMRNTIGPIDDGQQGAEALINAIAEQTLEDHFAGA